MTWRSRTNAIIGEVHASLPADADLKTRQAALTAAWPREFRYSPYANHVRQQAEKKYLAKFGAKPRGWSKLPPTPLEKAIAESEAHR